VLVFIWLTLDQTQLMV